uniref:TSA: Wollemia nobilis Ref_Wollemi_Transcript_25208_1404 transcribed RNA sequence n=1 Tax=Wollemia nobilis TaxID=56998 RepID=A0A0C9RQG5_9CONI
MQGAKMGGGISGSRFFLATIMVVFGLEILCSEWRAEGAACRDVCGNLQVKYPFGTGPGCGDPKFQSYVRCVNQKLMLTTHTGSYRITSVDYDNHVILIADPLMSTCNAMQNSGSFGLDWSAPFKLKNDVFVLLGCSSSSSLFNAHNSVCDTGSAHICSSLYSCPGVTGLGLPPNSPISSCCVYSPINLGPADDLNLPKLQCSSYTSVYNFGDDPTNPRRWKYGIALLYGFSMNNNYFTTACNDCQQSAGVCGYTGMARSFVCVCKNGVNTTANCYGQGYVWSGGSNSILSFQQRLITGLVSLAGLLALLLFIELQQNPFVL